MAKVDYRVADLVDAFTLHWAARLWFDPTPDEDVDMIRDWLWEEANKRPYWSVRKSVSKQWPMPGVFPSIETTGKFQKSP